MYKALTGFMYRTLAGLRQAMTARRAKDGRCRAPPPQRTRPVGRHSHQQWHTALQSYLGIGMHSCLHSGAAQLHAQLRKRWSSDRRQRAGEKYLHQKFYHRAGARQKAAQGRAGGRAKSLSISEGYFMKIHSRTIVFTIATCVPSCARTEAPLR